MATQYPTGSPRSIEIKLDVLFENDRSSSTENSALCNSILWFKFSSCQNLGKGPRSSSVCCIRASFPERSPSKVSPHPLSDEPQALGNYRLDLLPSSLQ